MCLSGVMKVKKYNPTQS